MKKRLLSLFLAICLICSFVPMTASAAEIVAGGTVNGSNISWKLDSDGLLTISGSGEMPRCAMETDVAWIDYMEDITAAVVEPGITNIGYFCFYKCYRMETVSLPDSVTRIDPHAFYWCRSLTEITLPARLTSIDLNAFYNCDNLETIRFGSKLAYIGKQAFDSCRALTEITLPASVETLDSYAFRSCENLRTVTFQGDAPEFVGSVFSGNGILSNMICRYPLGNDTWTADVMKDYGGRVTWEGYEYDGSGSEDQPEPDREVIATGSCGPNAIWTFTDDAVMTISGTGPMTDYDYSEIPWKDYRKQITAFVVEEGITSVGTYAFAFCNLLTEISLPSTVTSIGSKAIYAVPRLSAIHVAENNPCYSSIDGVLFNQDRTVLIQAPTVIESTYSIPAGVTAIGNDAFSECDNLREVTIPEGVTSIGDGAFYYCQLLADVTLPDSLTSIGDNAFMFCYSLKEITIPAAVTSIGAYAFYDSNVSLIRFQGDQPEIGEYAFGTLQVDVYFPAKYEAWWTYQDVYGAKVIAYIPYEIVTLGDLNSDGVIDDTDVALLLWHTLFPDDYGISGNADFTGDSVVDDADVAYLLWHTLFPDAYPL